MLPISEAESLDLGRDRSESNIILASAFAIGGALWTGERSNTAPTKGGIKGVPSGSPTIVAVTAYFYDLGDLRLFTSLADVEVANADYEWVSPGNQDIRAGDVYTSDAEPTIKFQIMTSQYNGFHRYGTAERTGSAV